MIIKKCHEYDWVLIIHDSTQLDLVHHFCYASSSMWLKCFMNTRNQIIVDNWLPIIFSYHMFTRIIINITESIWQSLPWLFFHSFDCIIDLVKYHQSLDINVDTRRVIETLVTESSINNSIRMIIYDSYRFHSHYWSVILFIKDFVDNIANNSIIETLTTSKHHCFGNNGDLILIEFIIIVHNFIISSMDCPLRS